MSTNNLDELIVRREGSLLEAMRLITENRREVALVVEGDGCLVGVITDGDIRRGLIRGLSIDAPAEQVMTTDYTFVGLDSDRAAVLDLMKARAIRHVPILDEARRVLGIHFLGDLITSRPRPNAVLIMAGGKGTRLHPITQGMPKPMISVAGRPILERLVLQLVGQGISRIFIALHYMPDVIRDHFGDGRRYGCRIEYLIEPEPLGTGGALSLLAPRPQVPLLVMNGDLVMQIDIGQILDFHSQQGGRVTMAVRPYGIEIPFGVVQVEQNRLRGLQEKPTSIHLINAGVYVVEPSAFDFLPRRGAFPMTALLEGLLEQDQQVNVFNLDSEWIDVGRHEELRRARGES